MFSHSFIVDGEEDFSIVAFALERAIEELKEKHGLTLKVKDVILEKTPHGNGMWTYIIKTP